MKKDYTKTSEITRREIFNLIQMYLHNQIDMEKMEYLVRLLTEQNPYVVDKFPQIQFENLSHNGNQVTNAYYLDATKSMVINTEFLESTIVHTYMRMLYGDEFPLMSACTVDFLRLLSALGHELKHSIQIESIKKYGFGSNDNYFIYLGKVANAMYYFDKEEISNDLKLLFCLNFFKDHSNDDYFKTIDNNAYNKLAFATYLRLFHESDARVSSFNFKKGMVKTMLNDPMVKEYPEVEEMLKFAQNSIEISRQNLSKDEYLKQMDCLDEFAEHIMDTILEEKVDKEKLNNRLVSELGSFASIICFSNNVDKIQKTLTKTEDFCPLLSVLINTYTQKLHCDTPFKFNQAKVFMAIESKLAEDSTHTDNNNNDNSL